METERASPRYSDIDVWDPSDILDAMIEGQFTAVAAVRSVRPAIERAARATEARLKQGGRLIYAGAGTSGRLAVQDGAELMPTFSWPQDRLLLLMAGGKDALLHSVEGAEDETEQAVRLIRQHNVAVSDVVLANEPHGLLGFVLGTLDGVQQRILAARHQQQQPVLRPAEGRHQFGAVLDREPAGRAGTRIDQAAALLEPRLGGPGGPLNRRPDGAHGRDRRELPLDHGVQDVG